ncbi:MAG: hypothetical protein ACHRHE_10805 [Tepidisphaerales bacterium]
MTRDNLPQRQPLSSAYAPGIARVLKLLPILAVFVAMGFGSTVLVAAVVAARERDNRVKCARNLRQIGQALQLYANDNKCYPRTYYDPKKVGSFEPDFTGGAAVKPTSNPFKPVDGGSVGANNVLAAVFLLVRTTDLNPEVFVCPSSANAPDTFKSNGKVLNLPEVSNFTAAANISYSFTNPYPTTQAVAAGGISPIQVGYKWSPNVTADFAIAADRNDGFTKKEDAAKVALMDHESPQAEQSQANSRNHEQDGQNVLFNDGHVDWAQTMWVGANRDGIYTAAKVWKPADEPWRQVLPIQSKDTLTADPQIDLDTILMPKF